MASAAVEVSIEGVGKEFGQLTALESVDLAVDEPSIVGVAGPNGSGKTTLFRCILGLLAPSRGQVLIDGDPAPGLGTTARGGLGYMPQREAVYQELTVRGNVDFFARLYGVDDRTAAVDRALSFVDLEDRARSRIDTLSGGMIRRTSLACALVHDPDLLLLDEPTVGLDPELRAAMWEGFRARRDDGAIVLVSTLYLGEAGNCDRVLLLRSGSVLAYETPSRLLERTGAADLEEAFLSVLDTTSGAA